MDGYALIGLCGVGTVIVAYALMTAGKLEASSKRYQWMNVLGTAGILVSMISQFNLPAFIANAAWIMIGIVSLVQIYRKQRAV